MSKVAFFDFSNSPSFGVNAFVVKIPVGLASSEALLHALYEKARLPNYFGFNWDALSDCLRDLHWIEKHDIVLLHADLPALPSADLRTYLDVLAECVASWRPGEEHSLRVVFPTNALDQVIKVCEGDIP